MNLTSSISFPSFNNPNKINRSNRVQKFTSNPMNHFNISENLNTTAIIIKKNKTIKEFTYTISDDSRNKNYKQNQFIT